jgi:vancomycin resistance protein VanJ
VRCSCGQVYHADAAHAGRSLRCRCGRAVGIPALESGSSSWKKRSSSSRSDPPLQSVAARPPRRSSRRLRLPEIEAPAWLQKWLPWAARGYAVFTAFIAAFIWTQGDNLWPATVILYGPRWLLLLPILPLAVAALLFRPRLLVPLAAGLLITLGPVMGFRTGWRTWFGDRLPRALRVISFNLQGEANPMLSQLPGILQQYEADVMVFQECPERMAHAGLWPAGWKAHFTQDGFCLASRFPVVETKVLERFETIDQSGTGNAAIFRLRTGRGIVDFVALHLETPRQGLAPLRREGSSARLSANIQIRAAGARRISHWIRRETRNPVIAGDLNLPVESRIYQTYFGHCANAFSVTGRGFGWTRVLKNRFSVRIDHILACGAWQPISSEVGPDLGSDHLPLIADLGTALVRKR